MPLRDSIDKIVEHYIASVCREEFTYRHKTFKPRDLKVSPNIFQGFTCPIKCGGCCPRFSLDYIPGEERTGREVKRRVSINGRQILIYSDMQDDHNNHFCRNLDMRNGRCNIYSNRPFSCDFELIRFLIPEDLTKPIIMTQKLFGRGWTMTRVDTPEGTKHQGRQPELYGSRCTMTKYTRESKEEVYRKLLQLNRWAKHFHIKTCLPEVIKWVQQGPHEDPKTFPASEPKQQVVFGSSLYL